jgi:hypothetical protein
MYVSYCVVGEESFLVVPEFVHDPDTPISITFPQKTLQTNDKRPDCSQEQNKTTTQPHTPVQQIDHPVILFWLSLKKLGSQQPCTVDLRLSMIHTATTTVTTVPASPNMNS